MDHPPKGPSGALARCSVAAEVLGLSSAFCFAVLANLVRLILLLLAAALAAVAWGVVDATLPPVGLSPRAVQAAATALLLVTATNAASAVRGSSV